MVCIGANEQKANMNTLQILGNKFMAAYGDDSQYVYGQIRNECLAVFGDFRSGSIKACDWMDKSADEMEEWIVANIVPELESAHWPELHTKVINDIIWNACHKESK